MPLRFGHAGDFHLDEDRYFADTAQCLEWFLVDAIGASVDLFVINGDLTTYQATIKERNSWIDRLVEMANNAPVILVAGNHGAELGGDLYVFGRARGKHTNYLCTEPEFIELGEAAVAVFPYPRKAAMASDDQNLHEAFVRHRFLGTFGTNRSLVNQGCGQEELYQNSSTGGKRVYTDRRPETRTEIPVWSLDRRSASLRARKCYPFSSNNSLIIAPTN